MKKLLLSILATVGIAVILPVSAFAEGGTSDIAGTVTSKGNPVSGASVSVLCDGHTLTSGTTVAGAYIVQFPGSDCPAGSTATVTATKGGGSGSNSGTVNGLGADINLAIVNVSVVPEFGAVAGAGAALLGGGAFMIVRRKQLNQN
ncbi:MAG TPA: hypothetical protein VK712_02805 [Verrucomicrobiae bacterium]|jgi:hypothetical protein|nr:hypothetical protein [Verrucomicrobiae bacterium]